MEHLSYIRDKLEKFCSCSCLRISCLCKSTWFSFIHLYHYVLLHGNQFSFQLFYFLFISTIGFLVLKSLDPRTTTFTPRNLDLFFTSVSAATVSSMSTVEMEVFSNTQLIVLTVLMFIGGEVFTSVVGLHLRRLYQKKDDNVNSSINDPHAPPDLLDHVELGVVTRSGFESSKFDFKTPNDLKNKSINLLALLTSTYLILIQSFGVISVLIYVSVIPSAKNILQEKGLKASTFSFFTIASTFANCGFISTNENMMAFRENSGLLLILIPQVLLGNTFYPPFLRFFVWATGKFTKKEETSYLLKHPEAIGYHHLLSHLHASFLVVTAMLFVVIQYLLFCTMEWNSGSLSGLNSYQRSVVVLFQIINIRHAGESVVDFSTISAAVMVLFIVMMYLPPYTSFLPELAAEETCSKKGKSDKTHKRSKVMEKFMFSQLSYLVIFIILVCITERHKIKEDPLNFNVLNIVVEVISAYGNVGLTTGYNCDRRLKHDSVCQNKWFGFSGKWSDEGKLILIVVMFFGRLMKFNMNGGKAWKLL